VKLPRRKFLHLIAGAAALPAVSRFAWAQAYPNKPVRIIVGFAAGGGTDLTARIVGQLLSERLGQQFIIENRPGAGGNVAAEAVVRAPADGYTLLVVDGSAAINASLYSNMSFNFIRDLSPVANVQSLPFVMVVHPSLPVRTVPELIAYSKANPGKISMASGGIGTPGHLMGELFKMMTGAAMVHVPYRGGAPALGDLLGGQVQVFFAGMAISLEHIRSGKLRALAVTTSMRLESLPSVPTISEFVSGYEASTFIGMIAPRGTSVAVVNKLNQEVNAGLMSAAIKARYAELGVMATPGSPAEFGKLIAEETEKWGRVIKAANIKAE
jgi:tripartite-type tricarboxylate transporter receptor subunit TctC